MFFCPGLAGNLTPPLHSVLAPLVDRSDSSHSGTAVIMLVSVVLMALAVFVIYKFKRYCGPVAV